MTATNREWRFADALASDPQPVPEQWLEAGNREELLAGQVQTHPVLFRAGEELQYEVSATGEIRNGPEKERQAICAVYVRADGTGAHERIYPAEWGDDGVRPRDTFAAIASVNEGALSTPAEHLQRLYSRLVDAYRNGDDIEALLDAFERDQRQSRVVRGP